MIAHKKQFKIAGAIWLVIVMIICQIVPAFASYPTDDNGSWLPNSFIAYWTIYNDGAYETVNVTASVTRNGLDFVFPYNSNGIKAYQLWLVPSSAFTISSVAFAGHVYYDSGSTAASDYVSFTYASTFTYYYGSSYGYFNFGTSNPFSALKELDSFYTMNRCRFYFQSLNVSGTLTVHFDYITFDEQDITSRITVQNLEDAGDDLLNLAEDLAVPTPDTDAIFNGMDDAINHVNDSNYQSTYSFFKNDTGIMATYITIVLAMATLGYIFFGKRSA